MLGTVAGGGKLAALAFTGGRHYAGTMKTRAAERTLYLVCYDVCCPRRLRRVHKFLLGFRVGGQKSCFECLFTAAELRAARSMLAQLIDPEEDRVHIFQLDPRMACDRLGRATAPATEAVLLI